MSRGMDAMLAAAFAVQSDYSAPNYADGRYVEVHGSTPIDAMSYFLTSFAIIALVAFALFAQRRLVWLATRCAELSVIGITMFAEYISRAIRWLRMPDDPGI